MKYIADEEITERFYIGSVINFNENGDTLTCFFYPIILKLVETQTISEIYPLETIQFEYSIGVLKKREHFKAIGEDPELLGYIDWQFYYYGDGKLAGKRFYEIAKSKKLKEYASGLGEDQIGMSYPSHVINYYPIGQIEEEITISKKYIISTSYLKSGEKSSVKKLSIKFANERSSWEWETEENLKE